jgi:NAD+ synthase
VAELYIGKIMNYGELEKKLIRFLQDEVNRAGFSKVVLGISGGVDSAVVAVLGQKAFGDNFLGVKLPTKFSSQSSLDHAKELCDKFDINYEIKSIQKYLDPFLEDETLTKMRTGNISARLRMICLYDISAKENALVLGTSNKTEIYLGYGTLFGDTACAINPIGELYKTQIFEFAAHLKVPKSILTKAPSADLWEGQSDEDELGYTYKEIDALLIDFIDNGLSNEQLLEKHNHELVFSILKRISNNEFKRRLPTVASV